MVVLFFSFRFGFSPANSAPDESEASAGIHSDIPSAFPKIHFPFIAVPNLAGSCAGIFPRIPRLS